MRNRLSARIDRLPETPKRLLQTAAVLGREFAPALLKELWEGSDTLEAMLLELKHLEFLYDRPGIEEPIYIFKHALTQDVAYDSLLISRRQVLHAAAGHAMERLYAEGLAEHDEALAHHFTRGAVWEKAFDYLTKSGDKARQAYANQEAIAFYTQALEVSPRLTPALDERTCCLCTKGVGACGFADEYEEAIADFQQMRQLARLGQSAQRRRKSQPSGVRPLGEPSPKRTYHWSNSAPWKPAAVQHTGDPKTLARSLTSLASVDQVRGNLREADQKLEASLQICRREGYHDSLALNPACLAGTPTGGGISRERSLTQEGIAVARAMYDGFNELNGLAFLCLAQWSLGGVCPGVRVTPRA